MSRGATGSMLMGLHFNDPCALTAPFTRRHVRQRQRRRSFSPCSFELRRRDQSKLEHQISENGMCGITPSKRVYAKGAIQNRLCSWFGGSKPPLICFGRDAALRRPRTATDVVMHIRWRAQRVPTMSEQSCKSYPPKDTRPP